MTLLIELSNEEGYRFRPGLTNKKDIFQKKKTGRLQNLYLKDQIDSGNLILL